MVLVTESVCLAQKKNVYVGDVLHLSDAREPKYEAVLAVMTTGSCNWKNSAESLWGKGRISPPAPGKWDIWTRPSSFWVEISGAGLGYAGAIALAEGTSGLHIWAAHLGRCTPAALCCFCLHALDGIANLATGAVGSPGLGGSTSSAAGTLCGFLLLKLSAVGRAGWSWHGQLRSWCLGTAKLQPWLKPTVCPSWAAKVQPGTLLLGRGRAHSKKWSLLPPTTATNEVDKYEKGQVSRIWRRNLNTRDIRSSAAPLDSPFRLFIPFCCLQWEPCPCPPCPSFSPGCACWAGISNTEAERKAVRRGCAWGVVTWFLVYSSWHRMPEKHESMPKMEEL